MPKDYKNARRKSPPPRRGPPGWFLFVAGVGIGLFGAFLVFLQFHAPDPQAKLIGPAPRTSQGVGAKASSAVKAVGANQAKKPRFEFYTILPEMEVRVPEREISPPPKKQAAPVAKSQGTYVLQVGSFRKVAEADRLKANLALLGFEAEIQSVTINDEDTWHRVRLGPYKDVAALNAARSRLRANKMEAMVLRLKI